MIDSASLERFYFEYQTEWVPRGMSIQSFCSKNNVPYKVMERYIRDLHSKVHPVKVVGAPEGEAERSVVLERPSESETKGREERPRKCSSQWISVSIRLGNGLSVSHRMEDYMALKILVDKLEVLC